MTEQQIKTWARTTIDSIEESTNGDTTWPVGFATDADTLRLYDEVCKRLPVTDGREDLARLESIVNRAGRHASQIRLALEAGEVRRIDTTWYAMWSYTSLCDLAAKLDIPGGAEYSRELHDAAITDQMGNDL